MVLFSTSPDAKNELIAILHYVSLAVGFIRGCCAGQAIEAVWVLQKGCHAMG